MSQVYLPLGSLLSLELVPFGSRMNSLCLAEEEEARVAAWQTALGVALCFATLCFGPVQFLPYALLCYGKPWLYSLYPGDAALLTALLFGTVCTHPLARLQCLVVGHTLLLTVAVMLLRNVALLTVGGGLALPMVLGLVPAGIGYTLLAALLGVDLLALLQSIGRLATR